MRDHFDIFNRGNNQFSLAGKKNTKLEFLSLVSRIEKYNICVDIISRQLLYNLIAESWSLLDSGFRIPVSGFRIPVLFSGSRIPAFSAAR